MAGQALRVLMSASIVAYQCYVSPTLGPRYQYTLNRSTYALQAIRVHGPIKELILGTRWLLEHNPWSHGEVNHVPERGRWKPNPWIPPEDWAGYDNWVCPDPIGLDLEHNLTEPDTTSGL